MAQGNTYPCPNCGGSLKFDPASQKLLCQYCGNSYTDEEVKKILQERESATNQPVSFSDVNDYSDAEMSSMHAYGCTSCGAQVYADENTAVTICPYCGSPTVLKEQFIAKKPQYVLPFQIDKQQAVEALKSFYKKKPFLPKTFTSQNQIEKIQGVYVPFWLCGATMEVNALYNASRSHSWESGDDRITETEHYRLVRRGSVAFENVPIDASSKMPDNYMEALEPFDSSKLKPFDLSFMLGYTADSYDVSSTQARPHVDQRMVNSTNAALRATAIGYDAVIPITEQAHRTNATAVYAFLPVWLLSTKYHGKDYLFAINGQSGKPVGSLPADNGRFIWQTVLMALIFFAIFAITLYVAGGPYQ
ncbi:MAG: hypothetical protein ACTTKS_06340 [Bulleidia sp.]